MAEKDGRKSAAQAFSDFTKVFKRSVQSKDNSKPNIVYEDEILQKKINAREQDFNLAVLASYKKYLNPFRTFGKTQQAETIDNDEKNLLKAYNLFKAVRDANASIGDMNTFADIKYIHSPLTQRDCYTSGGEFIYLQCWLMFAQNITDYVPNFVEFEENYSTVYKLEFVPQKNYTFAFDDKEVMAAIKSAYHS